MTTIEDRLYSYNELFGPFNCEQDICGKEAWCILVTEEEAAALPDHLDRFGRAMHVFRHGLGTAVCGDHIRAAVNESNPQSKIQNPN